MLLPRIYDRITRGEAITLQSENGLAINPVHADDAASAVFLLLEKSVSGVFNCAGPDTLTLRQIAEEFGRYQQTLPRLVSEPGDPTELIADTRGLRSLGWSPRRRLLDHIDDVADRA